MTMEELSQDYERSAELIRRRMRLLRQMEKEADSPAEQRTLYRRRMSLLPLLRDCSHIARYTKSYCRQEGGLDHGEQ